MYTAHFLNIETGERRQREYPFEWFKIDSNGERCDDYWWWTEGNFGCGCNRTLEWYRAGGEEAPQDDLNSPTPVGRTTCDNAQYWVTHVVLPDGTTLEVDGEPDPGPDPGECLEKP